MPIRKKKLFLAAFVSVMTLVLPVLAQAQTPTCDALKGGTRELANALLQSQHPYACCDESIATCLTKKPRCRLAVRLANDICARAAAGEDKSSIERALQKRATSMMHVGSPVPIDLGGAAVAGDPNAKVTIVTYACPRCPLCAKQVPAIYKLVSEGSLKGKAKLYMRPFPIRSHEGTTEAAMGMMAAHSLGKYWPYTLQVYNNFDSFNVSKLLDYAVAVGLDRDAFAKLQNDAALRGKLTDSKREGLRNKVDATPTWFIDGYRYVGDMRTSVIEDVIEEEFEKVTGKTNEP